MKCSGTRTIGTILALVGAALFPPASLTAGKYPDSAYIASRNLAEADFPRWRQIARNVHVYEDTHSPDADGGVIGTVSLIVVTRDGVVLVDGQGDARDGKRLADYIRKLTPLPLKYVVVGADHGDHINGNAELKVAFPEAVWIASAASRERMLNTPVVPTEVVTDRRVLRLGGTELQILNLGRAHTGGDLAVYLPQTRVLFLSEIYLRGLFPAMRSAYPSEWVEAMKKAQAIGAEWVIPGHGFIDTKAEMKAGLDRSLHATEYVIAEARRLHAVGAVCESARNCAAVEQANWGPYADWAAGSGRFQVPLAIARVYQEIEGKLP